MSACVKNSSPNECNPLEDKVFWEFRHVDAIMRNEVTHYEFDNKPLSHKDKVDLIKLLGRKKISYLVSSDSLIYIHKRRVPYIYDMYIISNELKFPEK